MRSLSHQAIEELLGAFALDAVDDDERGMIEVHLADCPRCRAEVAGYRGTAALLAHHGERAPEGVWDRIADALDEAPPVLDLSRIAPVHTAEVDPSPTPIDELAERRKARVAPRSISLRVASAAAAVAAALTLVVGVTLGSGDGGRLDLENRLIDNMEKGAVASAAFAVLADPEAEQVQLTSADGRAMARLARLPNGTGFLVPLSLGPPPSGKVYQLWAVRSDAKISLGVLGAASEVVPFQMSGPVVAFAVTEERVGGVATTENQPLMVGYT